MKFIYFLLLYSLSSYAIDTKGEAPIDDFFSFDGPKTREVVKFDYESLAKIKNGELAWDTLSNVGLIRVGTPYLWGGDDWIKGLDCSHFTKKILEIVGKDYAEYLVTEQLKNIKDEKGLISVPASEMKTGDMLVYGAYDAESKWHGHVVILMDADYSYQNFKGLALGSHGTVGVQFVVYEGFPHYYRSKDIPLVNVVRVKSTSNN